MGIPQSYRLISARRGQESTGGVEGQSKDFIRVSDECSRVSVLGEGSLRDEEWAKPGDQYRDQKVFDCES